MKDDHTNHDLESKYIKNSLSLGGAVALGTGVMIGAGIFALLGQVAELSGSWFPYIFLLGAVISGFSAYSYIKVSNAYPSAGGIAMILSKAYGKNTIAASASVLMALSMVINESLVARTFGTYTMQLFKSADQDIWIPTLGAMLLIGAFIINISGNRVIGRFSQLMAFAKIGGIVLFSIIGLWIAQNFSSDLISISKKSAFEVSGYIGALALSILAYKGFTTITNSGAEIVEPHKNVGRAIAISLVICTLVYLLVAFAVKSNLPMAKIIEAKDFSLAEAAKPVFGDYGVYFTVFIAIVATVSGVIASIFAVSRMTTMLTEMELIPHSHFGMPGNIQKHMLVYVTVIALILTIFFDLSRIASMGAIFYLMMDMIVHWGILRNLRKAVKANAAILISALILDLIVLIAFLYIKLVGDLLLIIISAVVVTIIFSGEFWYLRSKRNQAI